MPLCTSEHHVPKHPVRQVEQPHSTDGEALAQKGVLVTAMPWLHPTFSHTEE